MRRLLFSAVILPAVCATAAGEFAIVGMDRDGTIRWRALEDHAYTVETRDGPSGPWEIAPPAEQWPIDVPEWTAGEGPAAARRFYRVKAEPVSQAPEGMVPIPGGTFAMGDSLGDGFSYELPVHEVAVSPFYMAETEVTKEEWDAVHAWALDHGYFFRQAGSGKAANHPVQYVEWYDAVKWCNARSEREGLTPCYYVDAGKTTVYRTGRVDIENAWVRWDADGYRLPTEAEWEYAARGGAAGLRFSWDDADRISHDRANYYAIVSYAYDESYPAGYHPDYRTGVKPYTSPAGAFPANAYGLYDMTGNVREWCWDRYDAAYYASSPAQDPRGPDSGGNRVQRGGAWGNDARQSRAAFRSSYWPDGANYFLGFRTVRTVP